MEFAVSQTAVLAPSRWRSVDFHAAWIWLLTAALLLYLGLSGGGYDLVVRSDAAVIVWWVVLLGSLAGVLPGLRPTRLGWLALALLAGFVAWTGLAATWSLSGERSLEELSRVAGYLGVLVLALATYGDRRRALRPVVYAVVTAAVVLIGLAVLSRLRPGLFPAADTTSSFLPGTHARLDWPLNYWNALAALVAVTLPLLLAVASAARTLAVQALAAAAMPLTALCGYLTFSRGGAIAVAVALVAFMLLAPSRTPKLATLLLGAAGSAALIAGAAHRHAVEQGLTGASANHEGLQLLVAVVLVCAGVGLGQVAIALAARHATLPALLRVSPRRVRALFAVVLVLAIGAAFAAGASRRVDHAWNQFKQPTAAALHSDNLSRFGTLSGNGRYAYWKTSVNALSGHALGGYGPGTFQLVWLPRAPFFSYVLNAHSLYFETLLETGIIGLILLGAFIALGLAAGAHTVLRSRGEPRVFAAGITAAAAALAVSAASDWVWQVPVLPVAVLLLLAAVLVPPRPSAPSPRRSGLVSRIGLATAAVAALIAVGIPLASTNALRRSQSQAARGNTAAALIDAQNAARVEPGAASPRLQEALLLELQGRVPAAVAQAREAVADESQNWQAWLVLSRLQAENGEPGAALAAYDRARALNPRSPLFLT